MLSVLLNWCGWICLTIEEKPEKAGENRAIQKGKKQHILSQIRLLSIYVTETHNSAERACVYVCVPICIESEGKKEKKFGYTRWTK